MDKKEKRILILDAAKNLFEEKGYHEAKISDIAKLAGIGKGTVYEYFESKQSLFEEMIVYFLDMYLQHAEELIRKETDPIKRLRILIELDWEISRDHGQLVNVVISRVAQLDVSLKEKFKVARQKNIKMVSEIIDYGIAKGDFKKVDSRLIAIMFKGTFAQANMEKKLSKAATAGESTAFDETTEALFKLFINSIKS